MRILFFSFKTTLIFLSPSPSLFYPLQLTMCTWWVYVLLYNNLENADPVFVGKPFLSLHSFSFIFFFGFLSALQLVTFTVLVPRPQEIRTKKKIKRLKSSTSAVVSRLFAPPMDLLVVRSAWGLCLYFIVDNLFTITSFALLLTFLPSLIAMLTLHTSQKALLMMLFPVPVNMPVIPPTPLVLTLVISLFMPTVFESENKNFALSLKDLIVNKTRLFSMLSRREKFHPSWTVKLSRNTDLPLKPWASLSLTARPKHTNLRRRSLVSQNPRDSRWSPRKKRLQELVSRVLSLMPALFG